MTQDLLERARAKQWFEANGMSVSDWSRARGFNPDHVYAVLNGRTRGRRGTAHRIAVALGIKAAPESTGTGPATTVAASQDNLAFPAIPKLP